MKVEAPQHPQIFKWLCIPPLAIKKSFCQFNRARPSAPQEKQTDFSAVDSWSSLAAEALLKERPPPLAQQLFEQGADRTKVAALLALLGGQSHHVKNLLEQGADKVKVLAPLILAVVDGREKVQTAVPLLHHYRPYPAERATLVKRLQRYDQDINDLAIRALIRGEAEFAVALFGCGADYQAVLADCHERGVDLAQYDATINALAMEAVLAGQVSQAVELFDYGADRENIFADCRQRGANLLTLSLKALGQGSISLAAEACLAQARALFKALIEIALRLTQAAWVE